MLSKWAMPLVDMLRIEPLRDGVFSVVLDGFGGVTLGCATLAAARTCPDKALHSLHTYFFRPVPTERPVELVVERLRDGRRFAHRRVQVRSESRVYCELMASFAAPAAGVEYQDLHVDSATPRPEALPSEDEIARIEGWAEDAPGPLGGALEWRWIDGTPWRTAVADGPSRYRAWVRPRFPLPPQRDLHAAALAFLSDYHSHMPVARKLGAHFEPIGYASLDQSLWLHRDVFWDDWWLVTSESDVAHAGRALTRRVAHGRDGRLTVSMVQEQLIPGAAVAQSPD
jgi:acyl-CoA thioesterase-2